jgi:hypothetical protein
MYVIFFLLDDVAVDDVTPEEWDQINDMRTFLKPFAEATTELQDILLFTLIVHVSFTFIREKYPTLGLSAVYIRTLHEHIAVTKQAAKDTKATLYAYVSSVGLTLSDKTSQYLRVSFLGMMLDPRFFDMSVS